MKENTEIGTDVINNDGKLLLKEGQKISKAAISVLNRLGVSHVYIRDEYCFSDNKNRYTTDLRQFSDSIEKLKSIGGKVSDSTSGAADMTAGYIVAQKFVDDLISLGKDFKIVYEPSKIVINSLVERSIYVAIMSTALGLKLNISRDRLIKLCLAALLKDIALISPKIKNVDENTYNLHPLMGYKYLKENYKLDEEILNAVLHHHELDNGTGFPNKLKGNEICEFARIIGLIDKFYDLKSSHDMIGDTQEMLEASFEKVVKMFDIEIMSHFFKEAEVFTLDTLVRLNTGDIAVVIKNNPCNILRPIVKIVKGKKFANGEMVELQNFSNVKIQNIVYYVD
ncbi:HD-GYP domain-containing protein [Anaerosporobacter sp.]